MISRLMRFLDYTCPPLNIYYISHLPDDCDWGSGTCSRFLCSPLTSSPVKIWLVGRVSSFDVSASCTTPTTQCHLHLTYCRTTDQSAAKNLLRMANPTPYVFECVNMSTNAPTPTRLPTFYDATSSFQNKRHMPLLSPTQLSIGDVVLVECFCVRWKRTRLHRSPTWTSWYTGFQLDDVSLLFRATDPTTVPIRDGFYDCL
ncbi:hypothetical protein FKP32DRAFT_1580476 [Trametes sanguinea]|nr:hypothetical protein FKP32DRAFT_1580476 [Trametes sanguinea]